MQVSHDGFMLRLICVFLGCYLQIPLVLSSEYDNRLIDWKILLSCTNSCHKLRTKHVTFYTWTNRLTHLSNFNLSIQLLLCGNKHLTTSIIKHYAPRKYIAPVMLAMANARVSLASATHTHRIFYATQYTLLCKN